MTEPLPDERPETDPLFLALARPSMFLGVPWVYALASLVFVTMVFLYTSLFAFLLWIPLHAAGYLMSIRDPRLMEVWFVCLSKTQRTVNRGYWGADSYQP